ncbi:DNA-3-methyladenine glycosylase I [Colwellia sp. E150_009]
MEKFENIYHRAAERKGGEIALSQLISKPLTYNELLLVSDNEVLAEFTRKIFQSGFVWAVVNKKWAGFEEVFWNFDIDKLVMMPDDMLERKATDPQIIRNFTKVKTVRDNAFWLKEVSDQFGSISQWLANWPSDDITGLWLHIKKHGFRLGGNTGPYALRQLGIDTFILSRDVEAYFRAHKLIDGGLTSKRNLKIIQDTFNQWRKESVYSLQELSQIVAYSVGDNYVSFETD